MLHIKQICILYLKPLLNNVCDGRVQITGFHLKKIERSRRASHYKDSRDGMRHSIAKLKNE